MSARSGIVKAMATKMTEDIKGVGDYYINNLSGSVGNKVMTFNNVPGYPYVTITPGPETREDLPSQFSWCYLTVYCRIYVDDGNDAQGLLESIITDIETFVDLNYQIDYDEISPSGTESKTATDMTITGISTDEGILDPLALGEVVISVRYEKHRKT